jgi:hypothetical protein
MTLIETSGTQFALFFSGTPSTTASEAPQRSSLNSFNKLMRDCWPRVSFAKLW